MRMVVISFIILLLLMGLWAWFYFASVAPTTAYYWDELIALSDLVGEGEWDRAKNDIHKYRDKWYDTKKLWVLFLNQKDIDNIDSSMRQVNIYIESEDKILAQAELERLMVLFNVVDENECLSLENIF